MNDLRTVQQTKSRADSTLLWGGLAGPLAGLLMLSPSALRPRSWGGWTSLLSSHSRSSPTSEQHAPWRTASTW